MKKTYLITAIVVLSLVITSAYGQGRRGQGNNGQREGGKCRVNSCQIEDLSDEQKANIKTERTKFQMEIQAEKNQLNELRAKKQTLQTTDPINKKELDKVLVSMNAISKSIHKKKVRHQQVIKSLLNDQQLVEFDSKGYGSRGFNQACYDNDRRYRGHKTASSGRGNGKGKGRYQDGEECRRANTPMLSDELKESFKNAHIAMRKKQQPYQNQLNELRAQYQTICTGKNIDLKKADKNIDQQAKARLEMMKIKMEFNQNLRSQLTDEQIVMWDSKRNRGGHGRAHRRHYN